MRQDIALLLHSSLEVNRFCEPPFHGISQLTGKSAAIICEDAAIEENIEWIVGGALWNNGQICSATNRILVHRSRYKQLQAQLTVSLDHSLIPLTVL